MDTKREIVDAAKRLLWDIGYEAMSPRRLMDESGAGQGSLYHHFRGKQDVAAAALDEIEQELWRAADDLFNKSKNPIKAIQSYLLVTRDGLKGCRLGRLAQEKSVIAEPVLQEKLGRYFEHVRGLVTDALNRAKESDMIDRNVDSPAISAAIIAVVQGGFVISRATQNTQFITQATQGASLLLASLLINSSRQEC